MNKQTLVNKQNLTGTKLEYLMEMLVSKKGVTRQKARKMLVAFGKPAVPSLINILQSSKLYQVRWEAAKTLCAIGDIKAIPSLVKALEDKSMDVAWLAAEALRKLKMAAWPALLNSLIKRRSHSVFCDVGLIMY
jgi:HEAT repeat protein